VNNDNGYRLYRGRCKELSEAAVAADPTLTLVRGHYWCPMWNRDEPHWWTVRADGTIFDPTREQFPSKGMGEYTPFDGRIACSNCAAETNEDKAILESNYVFCSVRCFGQFVGVFVK
jgi:hypothetical protein